MVYMGSKNRISKYLLPIITKDLEEEVWYVEPFVGGANMIDKVNHQLKLGADINLYLIALLKHVQAGNLLPEYITKEEHHKVKDNKDDYPDWYVGYCGFICSFRGIFFGGFSGLYGNRNYQTERKNNLLKLDLSNINFQCCSYEDLVIPDNAIIYCDPPYLDTTKYNNKFDSSKFWEWCRTKAKQGYKVYISEYSAPDDFTCIWEKEINSSLGNTVGKKAQEKLFVYGKTEESADN